MDMGTMNRGELFGAINTGTMVRGSDGELYIPGDYIEMERDIVHGYYKQGNIYWGLSTQGLW